MNLITLETEGVEPLRGDLMGRVLVLRHHRLNTKYQQPRFQIVKAIGGFGCYEGRIGRSVYVTFVADGEDGVFHRNDFLGFPSSSLVDMAMQDDSPSIASTTDERSYFVIARDGMFATGSSADAAMTRLRSMTKSPVTGSYIAHSDSLIKGDAIVSYPNNCPPVEFKLKKRNGVWVDATK